ncbi:hypothetical protein C4K24_6191 [Pseudomonas chlororaphis subsp. aurantiaca]|nr:hypothetical protein C4K24_6191 [Pseudomonas chlororaphis subsp. aurantiaca]
MGEWKNHIEAARSAQAQSRYFSSAFVNSVINTTKYKVRTVISQFRP